eukprot:gene24886-10552_t
MSMYLSVESSMQIAQGPDDFFSGPDELTCAICLGQIPPADLAMVAGCEHLYCIHCILSWTLCKEEPSCPQCKHKFQHLFVHRQLDGTITDFPIRESVVLLTRAKWFEDQLHASARPRAISAANMTHDDHTDAAHDPYGDYDEDDELEDYYFSSAAGRARVVLGNRRFGENGFVQSGRRFARPAPQQQVTTKKKNNAAKQQQLNIPALSPGAGSSSSAAVADSQATGAVGGIQSTCAAGDSQSNKNLNLNLKGRNKHKGKAPVTADSPSTHQPIVYATRERVCPPVPCPLQSGTDAASASGFGDACPPRGLDPGASVVSPAWAVKVTAPGGSSQGTAVQPGDPCMSQLSNSLSAALQLGGTQACGQVTSEPVNTPGLGQREGQGPDSTMGLGVSPTLGSGSGSGPKSGVVNKNGVGRRAKRNARRHMPAWGDDGFGWDDDM